MSAGKKIDECSKNESGAIASFSRLRGRAEAPSPA